MEDGTTRQLLDGCADAVISCEDGTRIPCCKYTLLTCSPVLKALAEDVTFDKEEHTGREVIPFPNIPSKSLLVATDILHGHRPYQDLDIDDIESAMQGIDVLGVNNMNTLLLHRLWESLVSTKDRKRLLKHADKFMAKREYHTLFLGLLWQTKPFITEMFDDLADVPIDAALSKTLMRTLSKLMPAPLVLQFLFDNMNRCILTVPLACDLFRLGAPHFHPGEMAWVSRNLIKLFSGARDIKNEQERANLLQILHGIKESTTSFDTVPFSASKINGTVLAFEKEPMLSICLHVKEVSRIPKTTRFGSWGFARINPVLGNCQFSLQIAKRDPDIRLAGVQVRVLAVELRHNGTRNMQELWYTSDNAMEGTGLITSESPVHSGNPFLFANIIRSKKLTTVRLDAYYHPRYNVLTNPQPFFHPPQ